MNEFGIGGDIKSDVERLTVNKDESMLCQSLLYEHRGGTIRTEVKKCILCTTINTREIEMGSFRQDQWNMGEREGPGGPLPTKNGKPIKVYKEVGKGTLNDPCVS